MTGNKEQGQYTHIVLLLDASSSMEDLEDPVVQVVDRLVEEWKQQALDLDDMTRLSIYQFSSADYMPNGTFIQCSTYDTDIARIKSLKGKYKPHGGTALIDAVLHVRKELALTPTIHGDHTFLFYVITDGQEMHSARSASELVTALGALPDNWTVAALVPDIHGKATAQRYGFPPGNIMMWDTTARGVEEVGRKVASATASYMQSRTNTGMRSTTSLFVGGPVDSAQVKAKLTPLAHSAYKLVPVTKTDKAWLKRKRPTKKFPEGEPIGYVVRIDDFINKITNNKFEIGMGWYQLFSSGQRTREKVQGNKGVAVLDTETGQVYVGTEARDIVGLPHHTATIQPGQWDKKHEVFVESTSDNRQLVVGTQLLIMK